MGHLTGLKTRGPKHAGAAVYTAGVFTRMTHLDVSGKSGEYQVMNQGVFYGKREQADPGVGA